MIHNKEKLDGCGEQIKAVIYWLDNLYDNIVITSGYRNEIDNRRVGGAKKSAHLSGEAVDFHVPNVSIIKIAAKLLDNYLKFPLKGMGLDIYKNYLHIDVKDRGRNEITYWTYDRYGHYI